MSEWREILLGAVSLKIGSGATPKGGSNSYKESGISLIRSQNVLDFHFATSGLAYIDEDQAYGLRNVEVKKNDILLNITGDSVARCCKVPDFVLPARVNQHVSIIRLDQRLADYQFIFYQLQYLKDELLMQSEIGATRKALTKGMMEDLDIDLPSIVEQKAIAAVLSSLDDKIDLLHRQNKTLETLAQTLFRHWFIDAAIKFYETELENVLTITSSKRIFYKEYISNGVPFYRGKEVIELSLGHSVSNNLFISKERYQEIKSKVGVPEKGDVLLTSVGTLGVPYRVGKLEEFYFKDGNLTWFKNFDGEVTSSFIYFWLKSPQAQNLLNDISIGSTQRALTIRGLKSLLVPIIENENERTNSFELLSSLSEKLKSNITQVRTLEQLRDTLLPKLMSGAVRVRL